MRSSGARGQHQLRGLSQRLLVTGNAGWRGASSIHGRHDRVPEKERRVGRNLNWPIKWGRRFQLSYHLKRTMKTKEGKRERREEKEEEERKTVEREDDGSSVAAAWLLFQQ